MLIAIGGPKGGTGKTTLATNVAVSLARAGQGTLLIDADPFGAAWPWACERSRAGHEPAIECQRLTGNLYPALCRLRRGHDVVVVDCPDGDTEECRSALLAADVFVAPLRPSQADLWSAQHLDALVQQARGLGAAGRALCVLSMTPTNPQVTETAEARRYLARFAHLALWSGCIAARKPYRDALCEGRGVLEFEEPGRAGKEITSLTKELLRGTEVQVGAQRAA
jgi:chromosome partitioning protein